jgi:hypothetical protein
LQFTIASRAQQQSLHQRTRHITQLTQWPIAMSARIKITLRKNIQTIQSEHINQMSHLDRVTRGKRQSFE